MDGGAAAQIQSHLEGLSFFLQAGIAGTYLSELLHSFKQRSLAPDELLFAQGDAPDYFYVLVRGSLQFLFQTDDGRQKLAGAAGAGDSFGELALLTGKPRSTTARAKTACLLLVFTPQVFARYLSRPASRLMSGVIGQLRELPVIARASRSVPSPTTSSSPSPFWPRRGLQTSAVKCTCSGAASVARRRARRRTRRRRRRRQCRR